MRDKTLPVQMVIDLRDYSVRYDMIGTTISSALDHIRGLDISDVIEITDGVIRSVEGPLYRVDAYSVCVSRIIASINQAIENRGNMNEYEYMALKKIADRVVEIDPSTRPQILNFPEDN